MHALTKGQIVTTSALDLTKNVVVLVGHEYVVASSCHGEAQMQVELGDGTRQGVELHPRDLIHDIGTVGEDSVVISGHEFRGVTPGRWLNVAHSDGLGAVTETFLFACQSGDVARPPGLPCRR